MIISITKSKVCQNIVTLGYIIGSPSLIDKQAQNRSVFYVRFNAAVSRAKIQYSLF